MKLSICMMIKNEEKYLDECLCSLSQLNCNLDTELIVVDTGSTDSSVEIAKKYTNNVYFHKWNNNFSEMRNITIDYATGDWILIIDGDEVLKSVDEIINFLTSENEKIYNTATLIVKNLSNENDLETYQEANSCRLFRNTEEFKYSGAVHNIPIHLNPIINLQDSIIHYGYVNNKELMERKFQRTATLLKEELKKDPKNIYYWYQLSVSYTMYGKYDEAFNYIEKAYKLIKNEKINIQLENMAVYVQYTFIALQIKKYRECENVANEGIKKSKKYLDLFFNLATAQALLEKYSLSINSYKMYFEAVNRYNNNDNIDKSIIHYSFKRQDEAYSNVIFMYTKANQYNEGIELALNIDDNKLLRKCLKNTINMIIINNDYESLKKLKDKYVIDKNTYFEFCKRLEEVISAHKEKEKDILDIFKSENNSYGILCKARLKIYENNFEIEENELEEICKVNFKELPNYFGDIMYFLIKCKIDLSEVIFVRESVLLSFIDYISSRYYNLQKDIYEYLTCVNTETLQSYKINRNLARFIITQEKINDEYKEDIIYKYLDESWEYLNYIYNPEIIELGLVDELKTDEDEGIFYIYKAIKNKENEIEYLENLRKSLQICNYLKNVVDFLKCQSKSNLLNEEMNKYKVQVKNTIENLICDKKYNEAKEIIEQYEQIVQDDIEILKLKSNIMILELQ
ncbi:glycosyltransferase family 2 protein [Clostridium ihumii]|uniref:glycosyltransferase family 2 protein n=1 Tax=Clostridium ihumii TaxID=1470356 RepID=UPI00058B401B|nr:glycosyltransferase family 2 protein [Clostridium ihumii]